MSETALDREPIELVEMVLPRCINVCGTSPCTATFGAGGQCYNTRATCLSPEDYRDTPDRHLSAYQTLVKGEGYGSASLTRTASLFCAFDVLFNTAATGVIWKQGGASNGVYLGVGGSTLTFRCLSSGDGVIQVDAAQFYGKSVTLYTEIAFAPSASSQVRLWAFDQVERTLKLLGSDLFTAGAEFADTGLGHVGGAGGSAVLTGENSDDWDGEVFEARFFNASPAPSDMSDNFKSTLWLGRGVAGEPRDEVHILPCLSDVGAISTKINLAGSDGNYQPLGRRATLDFTASDFAHSDIGQDPYFATRAANPAQLSTFWRKWLVRQKFGKIGALVRVHDGYAGQQLSDYVKRAYVLDKVDSSEDAAAFYCRDVLSRTEALKVQVPAPSSGVLSLDITTASTSVFVAGDVTADYPATGTVRINDETITYTGRTFDGTNTKFTGLTRGSDGSEVEDHEAEDLVQVCRRYTSATIPQVLYEWLFFDAQVQGQFVDLAGIQSEQLNYLYSYRLTTLITEPTGIDELIGQMSQECAFFVWWDERGQKIRIKAIRATEASDVIVGWSYEDNIVAGSFTIQERPKERLNVVTFAYNPRDYTQDLDKLGNFRSGIKAVNGEGSLPEQYGDTVQTRTIYSRFLTTRAVANQTASRLLIRYADVPRYVSFYVDAKDRATWVGDIITLSHPELVLADGARDVRRWLVVEAEETDPGHLVRYVCADITLDGILYSITDNTAGTYNAADFAAGMLFITDNDGLNPDGTEGATIS